MLLTSPKIWGKELENEGAAWMEQKCIFPMLSLTEHHILTSKYAFSTRATQTHESVKPNVAFD